MEGARSNRFTDFFKRCSFQFPHVIYIMGNHEHYHGDFATSGNKIKSMLESNMLSNVYLLDGESKKIDDVTFIGGTLWTDMNREDPRTMSEMSYCMNDYRGVDNSAKMVSYKSITYDENRQERNWTHKERPAQFQPQDSVDDHKEFLKKLDEVLTLHPNMTTVVCGHHAPSKSSTHPRYKHETIMNGAYSTNLDNFILDRRQIKLWTHGHTHEDFDYMIGTTRVVCNPRGYDGYEERADRFELKVVEI
jgi:Icc-related predicted phosphoesterase